MGFFSHHVELRHFGEYALRGAKVGCLDAHALVGVPLKIDLALGSWVKSVD